MTTQPIPLDQAEPAELRPGSRAARLSHPTMLAAIRQVADQHGVCIRPVPVQMLN
jgi:hypothetical protein